MSIASARRGRRHTVVEIDLADYYPELDDTPPWEEEEMIALYYDMDRARGALSAAKPDIQEALLRLERCLPLAARWARIKL